MNPQPLTPTFAISPQITPTDIEALKALGYRTLINNRPDDEEPGQPLAAEIEAAAHAAGLAYAHIPVAGTLTPKAVAALREVLAHQPSPMLAFCRSGKRSATLWQASQGQ
jgi:uncharacterized protein (TIGR01244 family)